jgi:hypothetical protein
LLQIENLTYSEQTEKGVVPMEQKFTMKEEVKKTDIIGLASLEEFTKRKREGENGINSEENDKTPKNNGPNSEIKPKEKKQLR